jgi:hypothetical protein
MKRTSRRVTLLDLVQTVQDVCRTDAEVVAVVTHMVNSGRVVLCGNFAAMRIGRPPRMAPQPAHL